MSDEKATGSALRTPAGGEPDDRHHATLERVYGARSVPEILGAYEDWANAYDGDNIARGFRLPQMAAAYVARYLPKGAGPVLDAACGTGLVGEALSILGYGPLHGLDLSPAMLEAAASRGVYERLAVQELGQPIPQPDGSHAACTCIGAFGPGHAPAATLDELARLTRPGGVIVVNVGEPSYSGHGFAERFAALAQAGLWRERERSPEFRPYLLVEPELITRIFVFERLGSG